MRASTHPARADDGVDATQRRLYEAEARASIVAEQLALTREWLTVAHSRLDALKEAVARSEADSQERLALLLAERQRAEALADALARSEADSQERLALVLAEQQRAEQLADVLARTEAESQERLALVLAERQRAEQLADALALTDAASQERLTAEMALRARIRSLAETLMRTELDSQERLTLLRAERARAEALRRQLAGEPVPSPIEGPVAEDEAPQPLPEAVPNRWRPAPQAEAGGTRPAAPLPDVLTVIRPAQATRGIDLRELWEYRYLFVALARRNLRVELGSARLGPFWSIARPLLFAFVFVTFRNFSNAETREGLPYPVWVYTGLLFWTYFTDAATNAAVAVRNDAPLLTKVYFPRILTPMVPIVSGLVTLVVGLVPIVAMMVWYAMAPGWAIVLLPIVVVQCLALTLGLGTIVSSISIENRDWERLFIFGLTVTLWISPVIYAPEMLPPSLRPFYALNPMVGLMLAFRSAMFGGFPVPTWEWIYSAAVSFVLLVVGIWAFRRTEIRLLDRL